MEENESQGPSGKIWLFIILVLALAVAAVAFWSGRDKNFINSKDNLVAPTPLWQARVYTVFYDLDVFSPTNIRIHVGDTVKFQNNSKKSIRVITDYISNKPELPGFDSAGDVAPDGAFSFTFINPGIFGYHNYYDSTQNGVVTVRP